MAMPSSQGFCVCRKGKPLSHPHQALKGPGGSGGPVLFTGETSARYARPDPLSAASEVQMRSGASDYLRVQSTKTPGWEEVRREPRGARPVMADLLCL